MTTPGIPDQVRETQFELWLKEMRTSGDFPKPMMRELERVLREERRVMVVYADWFFSDALDDPDDDLPEGGYAIVSKRMFDCTLEICSDLYEAQQFCDSVGVALDVQIWPDTPLWGRARFC